MTGKLIVIDGTDGAGKSTQAKLLKEELAKKGINVKQISFPCYDSFFGKEVAAYLRGDFGDKENIDPKLVSLLYALDRYSQKEKIKELLEQDFHVILDRYVQANKAYQGARDKELIQWIEELEFEQLGLPKPDITFYLKVKKEIRDNLLDNREDKSYLNGEKKKDIHESDNEYMKKVEETYDLLAEKERWIVINCTQNGKIMKKEDILKLILQHF